jgi:DNA helicase-2/ATP-dependent DNA helicase PcrA
MLRKMLNSPYFGRIDFTEDGAYDTEEIYIGAQSLFDENKMAYYVYDWRAPISGMYYDFGIGRASFTAPDGVISGLISLKRQYHIEKGELEYSFDSDITIDDEILQRELSKVSDAKIKTIIHSIQREQNRAIRCEAEHVLVFGPAGSGKTSVGLHRLAYLLYKYRGGPSGLTSSKVRIFSANEIFTSYIAGIIPELGEEDVATLDFPTLLKNYQTEARPCMDVYEQINYLATAEETASRRKWLEAKYSRGFIAFAENYIRNYSPALNEDIYFYKDIICEGQRIKELYMDRTSAGTLNTKASRVFEYAQRSYHEYFKKNRRAITALFDDLHDETYSDGDIARLYDEQKNIALADLRSRLMPGARRLYEKILRAWAKENKTSSSFAVNALRQPTLFYEDALWLFYIDLLSGRMPKEKAVRHILVDEAQDLCHLQHRILKNLFDGCHFTVLADVNQALYPDINIHDKDALAAHYGDNALVNTLTKSYRSTYQISRFAGRLLDSCDEETYFRRDGDEPYIIGTGDAVNTVTEILNGLPKEYNTVGILFSDVNKAAAFHKQIKNKAPVILIDSGDDSFQPGIMAMAVPFAKGLEFDAVICPEYGDAVFEGAMGRKLLYLICTRALHRLYLLRRSA